MNCNLNFIFIFLKVVGAIDQMDIDDSANAERNSGSAMDSKNNVDSNKGKGKRKLYVGTQSLGFRRDHMEVSVLIYQLLFSWTFELLMSLCY